MSVLLLTLTEFGSIAATLKTARMQSGELFFPLSKDERSDGKMFFSDISEEHFARKLIGPFVARLNIANQLAMQYTYLKPLQKALVVPVITIPIEPSLPLPAFLKLLKSLAYNVITNGGNTFLGVKDQDKLDLIIDRIERELRAK